MTMASKLSRRSLTSPREAEAVAVAEALEVNTEAMIEAAEAGEAMATLATTDPRLIRDPDAAEEK